MVHDDELHEFEVLMDLSMPVVKIGNYEYCAGEALRCLDPIAFKEECLRWVSGKKGVFFDEVA
jgi:hypothetical protein